MLMVCCLPVVSSAGNGGTDYYVDYVLGDDNNDGKSESSPLKTLSAASSLELKSGDRLLLRAGGIFTGSLYYTGISGEKGSEITISSYGDTENSGLPLIVADSIFAGIVLIDCSFFNIENIEITAENCGGIMAAGVNSKLEGISICNCYLHDICNKRSEDLVKVNSPIYIMSGFENGAARDIAIENVKIENSAYGIQLGGVNPENNPDYYISPEVSYISDISIANCSVSNTGYDSLIFSACRNAVVSNCSFLNCCLYSDSYTAPVWMHHSDNILIEKCEVAGTKNTLDGMTVDFDGWTTNSTYQYIYSHDNNRFMKNNCFDGITKNRGNTVRYCLSVNDNKGNNYFSFILRSKSFDYAVNDVPSPMTDFAFYNNTIVNCSQFVWAGVTDSIIANNIFYGRNASLLGLNLGKISGIPFMNSFEGNVTNNCFYGILPPLFAKNSYLCDPGFAGTDFSDKNSFNLCGNSPLVGAGIVADDNMGETDFFGNPLTGTHNIGCSEKADGSAGYKKKSLFALFDFFC